MRRGDGSQREAVEGDEVGVVMVGGGVERQAGAIPRIRAGRGI